MILTYSVYNDGNYESIIDDPIFGVSAFVKTQQRTLERSENRHKTSA